MSTGFDKVGKPGSAGPAGLIDIATPDVWNRVDLRTRTIVVRLYNYNIDGNTLKPEHQAFLRDRLVPFVRSVPSHVKLHGTASQSGDAAYNRQLSLERVLRVKQFLVTCGLSEGQVPGTQMQATGEDQSVSKSSEDAWDRAVTLVIAARVLSRPIPRPKPRPRPPVGRPGYSPIPPQPWIIPPPLGEPNFPNYDTSSHFEIRVVGGVEVAEGGGITLYTFQIRDKFTKETVYYDYYGGTVSGPSALPVSVTLPEDEWTTFSIAEPGLKVTDLSGGMDIGSVGPVNINPAVAPIPGLPGYISKTYVVFKGRRAINGAADTAVDVPGTSLSAGVGSASKGYVRRSGAKFKTP